MKEEIIKEELLAKVNIKDGKLSIECSNTIEIAERMAVTPIEVGKICNKMKIKIVNCQLGCF